MKDGNLKEVRLASSPLPKVKGTNHQQVLLPPIELQPPWLPRTPGHSAIEPTRTTAMATPKSKFKEPTNNGGRNNTWSLVSALTAFDVHTLSPGTLSPTFSAVPSVFIGLCVGAAENTVVYVSIDTVVFIILHRLDRRIRLHRLSLFYV